jgi:UDP-3-O-[3-hydroxymyristoyl] glucosamine N-acyltransferase
MGLTAQAIADLVGGVLRGDPATQVTAMAPLDRAGPEHVSFLATQKYAPLLASSAASIVLVDGALAETPGPVPSRIVVEKPYDAMLALIPHLYNVHAPEPVVASTACVGKHVTLGQGVRVDDYAVIGDHVSIGDGTQIYPGVTIYSGTQLGVRCIVHAGARLGCDGFGYVYRDGVHQKLPHVGRCIIGDDVEIGANTTIDRGSIDDTVIGDGTKIDNLVHVAHNVRIGKACLIMAQVGIAGSSHIGNGVILAGQVGVSGHVTIGDGARLAAQAGVFGDIPAGETWSGYPARPHRESLRASGALFKLSGMIRDLERLVARKDVA